MGKFASSDGTPLQAGMNPSEVRRRSAEQIDYPLTGVVWAVHYPDDPQNISGAIEYTVVLATRQVISNVRSSLSTGGYVNGLHRTLNPTTTNLDGGELDKYETPLDALDGDHVLLIAPYGQGWQLVIAAILQHPRAEYSPIKADGHQLRYQHNGTTIKVDNDGAVEVERDKSKLSISKSNVITAEVDGTKLIVSDGAITAGETVPSKLLKESFMQYVESFFDAAFGAAALAAIPQDGGKAGFTALKSAMGAFVSGGSTHPTTILKGE